jgi:hypothetical protein
VGKRFFVFKFNDLVNKKVAKEMRTRRDRIVSRLKNLLFLWVIHNHYTLTMKSYMGSTAQKLQQKSEIMLNLCSAFA